MTPAADALPDDPETLKAMLIAERVRAERLRQIIKEMQRHRFGRRAETLPEDQLVLALEDVEQREAGEAAEAEAEVAGRARGAAHKRRANRGSLPAHLPRIETVVDVEDKACPCCAGELHRIGEDVQRAAGRRARPVPRAGRAPAQIRLPRLRGRRRPGAGAGAADRGRHADRGDGRPCAGLQIRRSPAALSPGADLRPPGHRSRSLDARRLGRPRRLPSAAGP